MANRDFSQYIVNPEESGPEADFGAFKVRFKSKQPLSAITALVDETTEANAIERSKKYLRTAVMASDAEGLELFFEQTEAAGLSAIVDWLTTEYSTFPTETPSA